MRPAAGQQADADESRHGTKPGQLTLPAPASPLVSSYHPARRALRSSSIPYASGSSPTIARPKKVPITSAATVGPAPGVKASNLHGGRNQATATSRKSMQPWVEDLDADQASYAVSGHLLDSTGDLRPGYHYFSSKSRRALPPPLVHPNYGVKSVVSESAADSPRSFYSAASISDYSGEALLAAQMRRQRKDDLLTEMQPWSGRRRCLAQLKEII